MSQFWSLLSEVLWNWYFELTIFFCNVVIYIYVCMYHTIYTRNNMGQKCEGNCGLWVLNEILKKMYPENLKKIVGAVWEIPAK